MKIRDHLYAFIWDDPMANNCNTYLIDHGKRILIDPGHAHLFGHVRTGLDLLSLGPKDMDVVVITHAHPDHLEGVTIFENTLARTAIHEKEMEFIRSMAPHFGGDLSSFEAHVLLQEGELHVGGMSFQVIHTPGHSPGSLCLYWPEAKALFTGDVLFAEGLGRTDLPGGDGERLKESIRRLSILDVEYLLPGHGEIVSGKQAIAETFENVINFWFAYI